MWDSLCGIATSSRPTRENLGVRWDRRRSEVLTGAARVFSRRGYERTSVAELAEELGLATGAIYHYFSGKEELLIGICDQLMDPLLARAEELLASPSEPGEPEPAPLRPLVRLWVEHVAAHRHHLLVFNQVRHLVDHGSQWRGVRAARKRFETLLAGAIERAGGDERESVATRLQLAALLGMVNHTPNWYRPGGSLSPRRIADGYVDLLAPPR